MDAGRGLKAISSGLLPAVKGTTVVTAPHSPAKTVDCESQHQQGEKTKHS